MNRTIMAQFIKNELDAYISTQRVYLDQDMVNLIMRAFEAYEEYKRLVSYPKTTTKGYDSSDPICQAADRVVNRAQR